jgi:uncharacterized protein YbjT (DUF2867 family)
VGARLEAVGADIRLITRDPSKVRGSDVAAADYTDRPSMVAALTGVDTLFLVSATESADRVAVHVNAVDAAVEADVRRIVYTSFLGAAASATFTLARDHWRTEEHIKAAGLAHTFLRDSLYLDVLPDFVGADHVLRGPAADGRFAPVSRDDVAEVAAAVLVDPTGRHVGRTYDLTGPELITMAEVTATLAEFTGRPVRYEAETLDQAYASRSGYGAPRWEVDGWVTSYAAIAAGELELVSPAVPELTGRPAQTLRQFLAANPRSWAHLTT